MAAKKGGESGTSTPTGTPRKRAAGKKGTPKKKSPAEKLAEDLQKEWDESAAGEDEDVLGSSFKDVKAEEDEEMLESPSKKIKVEAEEDVF